MALPTGLTGYHLTFNEDFNALSLNTGTAATAGGRWKTSDGWGNRTLTGNGELQMYVDKDYKGLGINPFSITDGVLKIHAAKVTDASIKSKLGGYSYTSGELTTAGSFSQQYGYFEVSAKMPAGGKGFWPAFWMLPADKTWPPEIDVMEGMGSAPYYVSGALHSKDGNKGYGKSTSTDTSSGFHTYGVEWKSDKMTFFFDGTQMYSTGTPSDMHKKFYMLLNLAVGGTMPGSPNSTTNWSKSDMYVDYVRAYSKDSSIPAVGGGSTPTPSTPSTGGSSSGSSSGGSTSTTTGSFTAQITNGTDPGNMSSVFKAAATGANTSRTYSGSQMNVSGVPSDASVTVSYQNKNEITVNNNGDWNSVKNVLIKSTAISGSVTARYFVDAEIQTGAGADNVTVEDAKRGWISTGGGTDVVKVETHATDASNALMKVSLGDGDDRLTFTGDSQATGQLSGGAGADRISDLGAGAVTIASGSGRDVMEFVSNAHATISDFTIGEDRLVMKGMSMSDIQVSRSGGNTYVDLDGGGRITLAGISATTSQMQISAYS